MAEIPGRFLVHSVTVRRHAGRSSKGDLWSNPVTVRCFLSEKRSIAVNADGEEVVCEATVAARLTHFDDLAPGSRVTLPDGRTTEVVSRSRADDGGMGAWQHVQAVLR